MLFSYYLLASIIATGFFLTGSGEYSLRLFASKRSEMAEGTGFYQGFRQSFGLSPIIQASDKASFHMRVKLFTGAAQFLGSMPKDEFQNSLKPDYKTLRPFYYRSLRSVWF